MSNSSIQLLISPSIITTSSISRNNQSDLGYDSLLESRETGQQNNCPIQSPSSTFIALSHNTTPSPPLHNDLCPSLSHKHLPITPHTQIQRPRPPPVAVINPNMRLTMIDASHSSIPSWAQNGRPSTILRPVPLSVTTQSPQFNDKGTKRAIISSSFLVNPNISHYTSKASPSHHHPLVSKPEKIRSSRITYSSTPIPYLSSTYSYPNRHTRSSSSSHANILHNTRGVTPPHSTTTTSLSSSSYQTPTSSLGYISAMSSIYVGSSNTITTSSSPLDVEQYNTTTTTIECNDELLAIAGDQNICILPYGLYNISIGIDQHKNNSIRPSSTMQSLPSKRHLSGLMRHTTSTGSNINNNHHHNNIGRIDPVYFSCKDLAFVPHTNALISYDDGDSDNNNMYNNINVQQSLFNALWGRYTYISTPGYTSCLRSWSPQTNNTTPSRVYTPSSWRHNVYGHYDECSSSQSNNKLDNDSSFNFSYTDFPHHIANTLLSSHYTGHLLHHDLCRETTSTLCTTTTPITQFIPGTSYKFSSCIITASSHISLVDMRSPDIGIHHMGTLESYIPPQSQQWTPPLSKHHIIDPFFNSSLRGLSGTANKSGHVQYNTHTGITMGYIDMYTPPIIKQPIIKPTSSSSNNNNNDNIRLIDDELSEYERMTRHNNNNGNEPSSQYYPVTSTFLPPPERASSSTTTTTATSSNIFYDIPNRQINTVSESSDYDYKQNNGGRYPNSGFSSNPKVGRIYFPGLVTRTYTQTQGLPGISKSLASQPSAWDIICSSTGFGPTVNSDPLLLRQGVSVPPPTDLTKGRFHLNSPYWCVDWATDKEHLILGGGTNGIGLYDLRMAREISRWRPAAGLGYNTLYQSDNIGLAPPPRSIYASMQFGNQVQQSTSNIHRSSLPSSQPQRDLNTNRKPPPRSLPSTPLSPLARPWYPPPFMYTRSPLIHHPVYVTNAHFLTSKSTQQHLLNALMISSSPTLSNHNGFQQNNGDTLSRQLYNSLNYTKDSISSTPQGFGQGAIILTTSSGHLCLYQALSRQDENYATLASKHGATTKIRLYNNTGNSSTDDTNSNISDDDDSDDDDGNDESFPSKDGHYIGLTPSPLSAVHPIDCSDLYQTQSFSRDSLASSSIHERAKLAHLARVYNSTSNNTITSNHTSPHLRLLPRPSNVALPRSVVHSADDNNTINGNPQGQKGNRGPKLTSQTIFNGNLSLTQSYLEHGLSSSSSHSSLLTTSESRLTSRISRYAHQHIVTTPTTLPLLRTVVLSSHMILLPFYNSVIMYDLSTLGVQYGTTMISNHNTCDDDIGIALNTNNSINTVENTGHNNHSHISSSSSTTTSSYNINNNIPLALPHLTKISTKPMQILQSSTDMPIMTIHADLHTSMIYKTTKHVINNNNNNTNSNDNQLNKHKSHSNSSNTNSSSRPDNSSSPDNNSSSPDNSTSPNNSRNTNSSSPNNTNSRPNSSPQNNSSFSTTSNTNKTMSDNNDNTNIPPNTGHKQPSFRKTEQHVKTSQVVPLASPHIRIASGSANGSILIWD